AQEEEGSEAIGEDGRIAAWTHSWDRHCTRIRNCRRADRRGPAVGQGLFHPLLSAPGAPSESDNMARPVFLPALRYPSCARCCGGQTTPREPPDRHAAVATGDREMTTEPPWRPPALTGRGPLPGSAGWR